MASVLVTLATGSVIASLFFASAESKSVSATTVQTPAIGAADCPVTLPPAGGRRYANDWLATGLYPAGTVVFRPGGPGLVLADGALSMKFWWWRLRSGRLTFEGRRLDGPAPPLRARVPDGYGDIGFQSVGLIFPTPGCWEVTGRVGDGSLSFVTLVEKIGDGPCGREVTKLSEIAGSVTTTAWNENPYAEVVSGVKLTHATGERLYVGGIEGTSTLQYLIAHRADQTATFVGYERITGSVKRVSGSFIIQHAGTIENGIARSAWSIVSSSGTDALAGIAGEGTFSSGHDRRACYSLAYAGL